MDAMPAILGAILMSCAIQSPAEDLSAGTFANIVDKQGAITLPRDYRAEWTHLGSWVVAAPGAPGHGFHDVYTQREAARAYRRSGTFPDGTVLVKEIRSLAGAAMTTGDAVWAAEPTMWFVMVRDLHERFSGDPDWAEGWGWALFEASAPDTDVSAGFAGSCRGCHIPARTTEWVFVDGYPDLRDARRRVPAAD